MKKFDLMYDVLIFHTITDVFETLNLMLQIFIFISFGGYNES